MQEWLIQHGRMPNVFYKHKLNPVAGHIDVPNTPGLNMDLAEEGLTVLEERTLTG